MDHPLGDVTAQINLSAKQMTHAQLVLVQELCAQHKINTPEVMAGMLVAMASNVQSLMLK